MTAWPALERAVERELAAPPAPAGLLARRARARLRRFPPGGYVLGYHSIVDRRAHEPWEAAYRRVATWLDDFEAHLDLLCSAMAPSTLPELEEELAAGPPTRAVFALTFDDAYANVAAGAADACERRGLAPTVFASADFCAGRSVYHRVLLSVLAARGLVGEEELREAKDAYVPGETEEAARAAWQRLAPGEPEPRAHLTFEGLRGLVARGWTVGNHGRSHATLAGLDDAALEAEVLGNEAELAREGLAPLPWLAYPNGAARHVGPTVRDWLGRRPGYRGLFGAGGVNLAPARDEWLRIPVGDFSAAQLARRLDANARATRLALAAAR